MQKKKVTTLVLLFLGIAFVASCHSTPRPAWVARWLDNQICDSPCWENVLPGVTALSDVRQILALVPEVTRVDGPKEWVGGEQCVNWYMKECGAENVGLACSKNTDQQIITTVEIHLNCSDGPRVTLGDIIRRFGSPDYVISAPYEGGCGAYILYKKGIELYFLGGPLAKKVNVSSNWSVDRLILFPRTTNLQATLDLLNLNDFSKRGTVFDWAEKQAYPCLE